SEADYSPTTMYRDFAINQNYFHWESQTTTSSESVTGQRYVNHGTRGTNVVLFVRRAKSGDLGTEPYTCLGTAQFDHASGSRPMQIVWELDRSMPVDLFLEAKAAACVSAGPKWSLSGSAPPPARELPRTPPPRPPAAAATTSSRCLARRSWTGHHSQSGDDSDVRDGRI